MCYGDGMRRNAKSVTASPDIVKHIEGLTEANFNLLTKLIDWLEDHEAQQMKFRLVTINKLAQMDAAISLILVGQQATQQGGRVQYYAEQLMKDAMAAEEFIAGQSEEVGMKMIRYIYGKDQAPEPRYDRRRRWSGWEI